ncbi:MAG: hypothetical protein RSE58_10905 [Clostridia bacterium]
MDCIDFDAHFTEYLNNWIEENRDRFKNTEAMEDEMPAVYYEFLTTPAPWLENVKPGEYFDTCMDAQELNELMNRYIDEKIPVPDPLMERLSVLDDEPMMLKLALDQTARLESRLNAVHLLREVGSTMPMVDFIRWQVERTEDEDLLEMSLECLRGMGEKAVKPAKIAFLAADAEGKEALLDLLCDYPCDEDVFQFALERFEHVKEKRALYAGYLAKIGNDHALEALFAAAEAEDVDYVDFIEIRSAIERLGSEAPVRDFANDPLYKAVQKLQKQ